MKFTLFQVIYNEGKKSGLLHFDTSLPTKDNESKVLSGVNSIEPKIKAYWLGYRDGMEIAKKNLTVG